MPTASRPVWRTSPVCVAYALDAGDDTVALRMKLWLDGAFALAWTITTWAPSTVTTKRRKLGRSLDDILAAPAVCDQLLTFASFPGRVEAHNNACERDLRPAVIQRKNANGYRAMWSAKAEVAGRTVVATARMTSGAGTFSTVLSTIGA